MFTPMGPEEQLEQLKKHCAQITTEKTVCYCTTCTDSINKTGKKAVHLLELVFPESKKNL